MYSLYSLLVLIVAVVASPWFIYQALRHKKYVGSFGQRMGYLPVSFNMDGDESIWIHAVSVGEVLTARPLISDLKRRYPNLRMFLSTTTMAGQQLARRSVQDVDAVFYFPFDLGFVVRRTLDLGLARAVKIVVDDRPLEEGVVLDATRELLVAQEPVVAAVLLADPHRARRRGDGELELVREAFHEELRERALAFARRPRQDEDRA